MFGATQPLAQREFSVDDPACKCFPIFRIAHALHPRTNILCYPQRKVTAEKSLVIFGVAGHFLQRVIVSGIVF
jgi:hypothetical protein